MATLSVQPNQNAKLSLANYRVAQSPDGGWNYFFNDTPITREQYAAGSGQSANADPAAKVTNNAPVDPNNTAGSAPAKVDKSGDIAYQQQGLGSVDTQYNGSLDQIQKSLDQLNGRYDSDAAAAESDYSTNATQNQNNLQKNKQTALVNAAQGKQGLYGTLASLGALSGTGIELANRAVAKGANDDLAGADDNYDTNQQVLDSSIGTFRREDADRRKDATTEADNARTNAANAAAKARQGYLGNIANDYSAEGDAGNAKTFQAKAGALFPSLAATNLPDSNIGYTSAAYTPASLQSYLAGNDSTQVSATPTAGGQGGTSLVASPAKKKVLQPA